LENVAKTVAKPKIAKRFTSKLNLRVQNIYIKPLLKPKNTCNKLYFETNYFGENVKKLLKQKVAKNVTISLGYFIISKSHIWHPKEAQLAKNWLICSPCEGVSPFSGLYCKHINDHK
jgi:hypothetical protein